VSWAGPVSHSSRTSYGSAPMGAGRDDVRRGPGGNGQRHADPDMGPADRSEGSDSSTAHRHRRFPTAVHTAVDNYTRVILHSGSPQCGNPTADPILLGGAHEGRVGGSEGRRATATPVSARTAAGRHRDGCGAVVRPQFSRPGLARPVSAGAAGRRAPDRKWTRAVGETPSLPQEGASPTARGDGCRPASAGRGRTYSHLVAKLKPTAMKAMPTTRFHWPRSLKIGRSERSSEKT